MTSRNTLSLPDPLTTLSGVVVDSPQAWQQVRRAEILDLFRAHVFGRMPEPKGKVSSDVFDEDYHAYDGKAIRKQVAIKVTVGQKELDIHLLIFLPPKAKSYPVPVFNLLNFGGNHTVHADPAIVLPKSYLSPEQRPAEAQRGAQASRFPIERILGRGYAVATVYCGDIDPDFDDNFKNGIHALLDAPGNRPADAWGSVGAWAWG